MSDATGSAMAAPPPTRLLTTALWICGAVLSFTLMAVSGRELATELNTFEVLAYRSALGIPVLIAAAWLSGGLQSVATRHPGQHAVRNLIHFAGQNLWFYALAVLPLAQVVTLEFTNPIWVALLAPMLLGERLTTAKVIAALMGFAGILVIAQPGVAPLEWGHAAGLGAALSFALTNIATKRLSAHDSPLCVLFWMTVSQTAMGFAIAMPLGLTWPSMAMMPWVAAVGATGLSAHFCLTRALYIAPASVVGPMEFTRLPVVTLVGVWLYGEALGLALALGALLILGGNAINLAAARRT